MKKWLVGVSAVVFSASVFANQDLASFFSPALNATQCSVPTDYEPTFCADFKTAVTSCSPIHGLSMQRIYSLMVGTYGSLSNACRKNASKYGADAQACIDQWTCYWNGGSDSKGELCDTTGNRCDSL